MHKRLLALCAVAVLGSCAPVQQASAASPSVAAAMQSAAAARQVPLPLVQAIGYVNTRWEAITRPGIDGSFLPMAINPSQVVRAASLSGHTVTQVETDPNANFDAGAALLARAHSSGSDLASWQPAVVSLLGPYVAEQVFQALRRGVSRTTTGGETITIAAQSLPLISLPAARTGVAVVAGAATTTVASTDYPPAAWVPASTANYSPANRPHDFPVDMIVIHDIEGSYGSAIQWFQNPAAQSSAHYVVSAAGDITQMVAEHDIAWHAGNWDYNTRAIGIEHEGFVSCSSCYTDAEYQASAHLAASICSRWGVPMDRTHVIGHYQVPDPNNPGQFGGAGHHTDPGPYWDWATYMIYAQRFAAALPSPPHMALDPVAVASGSNVTVTWTGAARTCHAPITGFTVVSQPGNVVQNLPGNATSATFTGLQPSATYAFTVTAHNSYGDDSRTGLSGPLSARESLAGPVGSGPAVASWASNRMDTFYTGTNGQLYHTVSIDGFWYTPESLGGSLSSAPAAVSWGPNRIDVFARGSDMTLMHKAWGGTSWSAWESLGGYLTSAPAVAAWSSNRLDIFARGSDLSLLHKAWGGSLWSPWESLGGALMSPPSVVAWGPNRLDIFMRGTDYLLYHKAWNPGWSAWESFPGTQSSGPTVSSWAPGRLDIFSLTTPGTLEHKAWTGSGWTTWLDYGGDHWQPDIASVARKAGTVDVFVDDSQSTLWHIAVPAA